MIRPFAAVVPLLALCTACGEKGNRIVRCTSSTQARADVDTMDNAERAYARMVAKISKIHWTKD